MAYRYSYPTVRARYLHPAFKVHNGNVALYEIYVINLQGESLSDPAAEMEQHANQQLITEIGCRLLYHDYFF
jgi:hypothetical protein